MASFKEFKVKVTVDTKDGNEQLEKTINTLSGFEEQIGALRTKLAGTPIGSKEFKELSNELSRTEKAFGKAQDSSKTYLQTLAGAPGLVGVFGQSLQGLGKAFGNIGMAIKTSMLGLLATIIAAVVEKMKSFDGVMEPINKVLSIFSAVTGKLANLILPAVVVVVEAVADGILSLVNLFSSASDSGKGFGDILSEMADRTEELNDATAEYEYQQSLSNAKLAEAREIAADSTKSIVERRKAVMDAAKIEEATAKEGKRIALEKARLLAQQMAVDMDLTTTEIENLKKADSARLKSFINQQLQNKALNGDKKDALLQQLAQINEIDAASSKIGKKTAATLKGIDNEVAASAKEAASKALEAQKNKLNAQIELEKNKANTDEKTLREYLEKKDELENKGTKKSKEELELQKQNREKAIKDALKADTDAVKAATDLVAKGEDDKIKIIKQNDANIIASGEIKLEQIKIQYGAESKEFTTQQNVIFGLKQKAIQDEITAIGLKKEQTEADKQRLSDLGVENQKLGNIIIGVNQKVIEDAKTNFTKQQELDIQKLEYELTKAEGDFERLNELINTREQLQKDAYDREILAADGNAVKLAEIELKYTKQKDVNAKARTDIKKKETDAELAMVDAVANGLNTLGDFIGKQTKAGKALSVAASLISTYSAIAKQLAAFAGVPVPGYAIIQAIATGLIGFKAVRDIMAVQVPDVEVPEVRIRKAMGGVLQGPTHAMGGIATPFGELEGGEMVVNRASTMMFRPQLETINSLGGGARDYNYSGFNGNMNNNSEPPIIKTYVVASEMSSQQEIDRVILQRSKM